MVEFHHLHSRGIFRLGDMVTGLQDIHVAERSPVNVLKIRHRGI